MKLHFYFLVREGINNKDVFIEHEQCEVIEKSKTYYPVDKLPNRYSGSFIKKTDIGVLIDNCDIGTQCIILKESNYKYARQLFLKDINKKIKCTNDELLCLRKKLHTVLYSQIY